MINKGNSSIPLFKRQQSIQKKQYGLQTKSYGLVKAMYFHQSIIVANICDVFSVLGT